MASLILIWQPGARLNKYETRLTSAPFCRVKRLFAFADLEIEGCVALAAAVADRGDLFAGLDPLAGGLEQVLVVTVQAQEAVAVIDDQQQAEIPQPVGEDDLAAADRVHAAARRRPDQHAPPFQAGLFRVAELFEQAAPGRPGQFAAQAVKGRAGGRRGHGLEFLQQGLQFALIFPEPAQRPALGAQVVLQPGDEVFAARAKCL